MKKNIYENCLNQVIKELKNCFFLLMIRQQVIIKFLVDFFKRYFLPRVKIENCNSEIDERNFYDRPINDSFKQHEEVRKISTGQGVDYKTGCLLDFASFEKNYRLIAADLSKQKALDADSRAIKQIIFTGKITSTAANTRIIIYHILKQSRQTILQFSKGTTKVLQLV